jgi:hypothetical protein
MSDDAPPPAADPRTGQDEPVIPDEIWAAWSSDSGDWNGYGSDEISVYLTRELAQEHANPHGSLVPIVIGVAPSRLTAAIAERDRERERAEQAEAEVERLRAASERIASHIERESAREMMMLDRGSFNPIDRVQVAAVDGALVIARTIRRDLLPSPPVASEIIPS